MNGTPFDDGVGAWIEKLGGSIADNRRLIEMKRKMIDGGVPERPVTTSDVQDIIRREIESSNNGK